MALCTLSFSLRLDILHDLFHARPGQMAATCKNGKTCRTYSLKQINERRRRKKKCAVVRWVRCLRLTQSCKACLPFECSVSLFLAHHWFTCNTCAMRNCMTYVNSMRLHSIECIFCFRIDASALAFTLRIAFVFRPNFKIPCVKCNFVSFLFGAVSAATSVNVCGEEGGGWRRDYMHSTDSVHVSSICAAGKRMKLKKYAIILYFAQSIISLFFSNGNKQKKNRNKYLPTT